MGRAPAVLLGMKRPSGLKGVGSLQNLKVRWLLGTQIRHFSFKNKSEGP